MRKYVIAIVLGFSFLASAETTKITEFEIEPHLTRVGSNGKILYI